MFYTKFLGENVSLPNIEDLFVACTFCELFPYLERPGTTMNKQADRRPAVAEKPSLTSMALTQQSNFSWLTAAYVHIWRHFPCVSSDNSVLRAGPEVWVDQHVLHECVKIWLVLSFSLYKSIISYFSIVFMYIPRFSFLLFPLYTDCVEASSDFRTIILGKFLHVYLVGWYSWRSWNTGYFSLLISIIWLFVIKVYIWMLSQTYSTLTTKWFEPSHCHFSYFLSFFPSLITGLLNTTRGS